MINTMMGVVEHRVSERLPKPPARDIEHTMREVPLSVACLLGFGRTNSFLEIHV